MFNTISEAIGAAQAANHRLHGRRERVIISAETHSGEGKGQYCLATPECVERDAVIMTVNACGDFCEGPAAMLLPLNAA